MVELDVKDKKLIYTLDFEARMPLTQLAKKLNISKQVAKYRLENLQKRNIIQGFYADINASKLGLAIYLVYFKFHHLTPDLEKQFIDHISKQNQVGVNVSINGKWDYCIGIWAESIIHFKKYYQKTMKDYEKYVKNKTVMIETDFYYFKPKQILQKKEDEQIIMTGELEQYQLDNVDEKILIELSKNCRISLVDLGKLTKLTPNGVKSRIKNLEKNKVILGYRVMINYPLLNFLHYRAFLHLENTTEEKEKKIIQFLKQKKSVVSATKTISYCELEFRAVVKDVHEFYVVMEELRNNFPDLIKDHESILYYKFHEALNYFPFSK
ncbi:Lrp/AsnC family transcriptional regulator [Nanoarchaeota archaeon]